MRHDDGGHRCVSVLLQSSGDIFEVALHQGRERFQASVVHHLLDDVGVGLRIVFGQRLLQFRQELGEQVLAHLAAVLVHGDADLFHQALCFLGRGRVQLHQQVVGGRTRSRANDVSLGQLFLHDRKFFHRHVVGGQGGGGLLHGLDDRLYAGNGVSRHLCEHCADVGRTANAGAEHVNSTCQRQGSAFEVNITGHRQGQGLAQQRGCLSAFEAGSGDDLEALGYLQRHLAKLDGQVLDCAGQFGQGCRVVLTHCDGRAHRLIELGKACDGLAHRSCCGERRNQRRHVAVGQEQAAYCRSRAAGCRVQLTVSFCQLLGLAVQPAPCVRRLVLGDSHFIVGCCYLAGGLCLLVGGCGRGSGRHHCCRWTDDGDRGAVRVHQLLELCSRVVCHLRVGWNIPAVVGLGTLQRVQASYRALLLCDDATQGVDMLLCCNGSRLAGTDRGLAACRCVLLLQLGEVALTVSRHLRTAGTLLLDCLFLCAKGLSRAELALKLHLYLADVTQLAVGRARAQAVYLLQFTLQRLDLVGLHLDGQGCSSRVLDGGDCLRRTVQRLTDLLHALRTVHADTHDVCTLRLLIHLTHQGHDVVQLADGFVDTAEVVVVRGGVDDEVAHGVPYFSFCRLADSRFSAM